MPRSIALYCALPLALALAACSAENSTSDAEASRATTKEAAAATVPVSASTAQTAAAAPAAESLGHYTLGDKTLELRDAIVVRNDSEQITVVLTPTVLTDEERAAMLKRSKFPGMALFDKTAPGYPDNYPFVKVEARLSGPASVGNVSGYYIMATGISEANHTDNLNGFPGDDARFELLKVDGEHVRMKFSGQTTILDKPRSWAFDIDV